MWFRSNRISQSLAIETSSAQTAEPLAAFHLPGDLFDFLSGIDDFAFQTLVISFTMIVR